jgi:hypothetical protein
MSRPIQLDQDTCDLLFLYCKDTQRDAGITGYPAFDTHTAKVLTIITRKDR